MKSFFATLLVSVPFAMARDFEPVDPVSLYAGLLDALSDLHDKRGAVEDYLRGDDNLDNFNCFLALEYLIDSLSDSNDARDRNTRYQAIGCLRDYPCDATFSYLESTLGDRDEAIRRMAALTLARLSFDEERRLSRLEEIMGRQSFGLAERIAVYNTISAHLQGGFPPLDRQRCLLRFLLHRTSQELLCSDALDEILCREIPKWRASPQRMENAERIIREHPGDARLVACFENVRTNALESARMESVQTADGGSSRRPAGTNATPEDHLPDGADEPAAPSDPWADLLEDLPEKKPSDSSVAPE